MSHEREAMSAYHDGELNGMTSEQLERLRAEGREAQEALNSFERVSASLHAGNSELSDAEVDASATRSWKRIQMRLAALESLDDEPRPAGNEVATDSSGAGDVRIPMPLALAATLLLVASFTISLWLAAGQPGPQGPTSEAGPVNVTVEVDDVTAEQLVRWLQDEEMIGDMKVSLPSSARFSILGEPALVRAEQQRPAVERAP